MSQCYKCGKNLTFNEIGATKKFINRGSSAFLCLPCLGEKLDVTSDMLEDKIQQFIQQGCTLFHKQ